MNIYTHMYTYSIYIDVQILNNAAIHPCSSCALLFWPTSWAVQKSQQGSTKMARFSTVNFGAPKKKLKKKYMDSTSSVLLG